MTAHSRGDHVYDACLNVLRVQTMGSAKDPLLTATLNGTTDKETVTLVRNDWAAVCAYVMKLESMVLNEEHPYDYRCAEEAEPFDDLTGPCS